MLGDALAVVKLQFAQMRRFLVSDKLCSVNAYVVQVVVVWVLKDSTGRR
jgi:hypothetical protein